ncbi:F-box/kelch-repeat protein [Camellia lanceoleosa]|uniref:F-box/kelch-repeat protein n=1 Tax=Camellia lanceoleosa TaxID=1840588 RepID=A0ACC0HPU2_9ERIC|nr:F-box/kelch-repeat protein [Camellia lanceoleosa]
MICSSSSGPSSNTFVYDSVINLWSQFDSVDSVIGDNHQEAMSCDGILYFTTPEPFSILFFDLENGNWERPEIEMPSELTFARLVSDGVEKMFLVGGIGKDGISRGMKVWELSGD